MIDGFVDTRTMDQVNSVQNRGFRENLCRQLNGAIFRAPIDQDNLKSASLLLCQGPQRTGQKPSCIEQRHRHSAQGRITHGPISTSW